MPDLSRTEIATVLAGLRLLQQGLIVGGLPDSVQDILLGAEGDGLSPEEIDELCERINVAPEERPHEPRSHQRDTFKAKGRAR
jgi:hypothetical protein